MVVKYSKKLMGTEHITNNFQISEFACKDGTDTILINIDLVIILQKIRDKYGAIKIISGYRTEDYNLSCGGSKKSLHLSGNAIDFAPVKNNTTNTLLEIVHLLNKEYNIKGIGLYINRNTEFIHFDNRENPTFWINDNKKQEYIKSFKNIEYV